MCSKIFAIKPEKNYAQNKFFYHYNFIATSYNLTIYNLSVLFIQPIGFAKNASDKKTIDLKIGLGYLNQ
jgi:hypothetical protein